MAMKNRVIVKQKNTGTQLNADAQDQIKELVEDLVDEQQLKLHDESDITVFVDPDPLHHTFKATAIYKSQKVPFNGTFYE